MNTRTLSEVNASITDALKVNNLSALPDFIAELESIGSKGAMASRDRALGLIADSRGENDRALEHLERALTTFVEIDDRGGEARVMANMASVFLKTGDYDQALELYQRSLTILEERGDPDNMAAVYDSLGQLYCVTGRNNIALEYFNRALDIRLEEGQRNGAAATICNLGNIYKLASNYPRALELYHRALSEFEELGNKRFLANVLLNMGGTYDHLGDTPKALQYNLRALTEYEELDFQPGVAAALGNVGLLSAKSGETDKGLEYLSRARKLMADIGEFRGLGHAVGNILSVLIESGAWDKAETLLAEFDTMQIEEPMAVNMRDMARADLTEHSGDIDGAIKILRDSLSYAHDHELLNAAANIHRRLRDLALKQNDLPAYVEHNNAYTSITAEINGNETASKVAIQEAEQRIAKERLEYEKQLAVLYAALPKDIAERVAKGETVSDHYDNAAVLFTDVVGFTTHSSALASGEVTALLESMYRRFDSICKEHGLVKVKTIGDSYLCFKGDDTAEHNTTSLAKAAFSMVSAGITWPSGEPLSIRVGIHVGPITAGVIGADRLQYDIWGDTVNVASRMENRGAPGRVNVTSAVKEYLELSDDFIIESRGSIDVKGKGAMEMFFVSKR